jgi:hypothetical protein
MKNIKIICYFIEKIFIKSRFMIIDNNVKNSKILNRFKTLEKDSQERLF